ncbi:MAG: prepilin-type N-terminal cleavage/methylation domain-containing protein [Planctomycetota bacterium]
MRQKAFTLIELLVVISVISLVMAILMPVLAMARRQSKTVMCLSNLRQLGIAAHLYASNNNDYYPIAYMSDPDPMDSLAVYRYWDFVHIKDWNTLEERVEPGLLWQNDTITKVHQCPSFKGKANADDPYTGYNYNTSYIGHGTSEATVAPAKMTQVKRSWRCALFGDGEYASGANKFMRSPWKSKGDTFSFRSAGTQGYRHNEKTNVAWCDGHVSSQKELYTETLTGEKERIEQYNNTAKIKIGFLSPDNSAYDLQ